MIGLDGARPNPVLPDLAHSASRSSQISFTRD